MFASLFAAALIAAAPADDAAVATALFEICPKILDGRIAFDNPRDLTAIGYVPSTPRGKAVWAKGGPAGEPVFVASVTTDKARSCAVTFVDDAPHSRFERMAALAATHGYQGPAPSAAGDPAKPRIAILSKNGDSLTMITVANHIELGDMPSTVALFRRGN
ncbi:hypothetical protein P1X14_20055 [Sphingomonas sp. AOB5]|uniref:hypothetical protein n=1 Tax=Sphingomonas sp. AOB5 TaxID=3034017 RepID=UPI0023F7F4C8|nr:hypothetical protein [Sphingomonas sp. AOB5]MDF7777560.1 hypothetical protein [Sphingomonas sp. AOB5]